MKLAILGHSPLALEAALRFHLHGAALTWYVDQDNFSLFDSSSFIPNAFTSDLGLNVLKEMNLHYSPAKFSWEEWKRSYERPLTDYLRAHQEVKTDEVVSVTKRYLAPGESIPGRSRFLDLFRIIYHVDPKEFIEDQKSSNPETYKRLTEEFVSSLASTIEMYQDYDLVFDFRTDFSKASASVAGRALGERRTTDKVFYAREGLKKAKTVQASTDLREIALIGSDSLAAEILLSISEWLKDQRSQLFIVTTEEEPFKDYLEHGNSESVKKLNDLFRSMDDEFVEEVNTFTQKLREWQELDDFVQVKVRRPVEPIPRLNYFSGHNVTAVDELIDRKRMFLTLERPEFRHGKKHPENNYLDLKTIGADLVLVGHARKDLSLVDVDHGEEGFFGLTPTRPNIKDGWENDLTKLEGIEDEIFKLFSPVDSH